MITKEQSAFEVDKLVNHLGSEQFKKDYGIKYAYVAGAMYRGIASKELVIAMGKSGLMSFLGAGGLTREQIASDIDAIQQELNGGQAYGVNLLCNISDPREEMEAVELYLEKGVNCVEASAFMQMTEALVFYRASGLYKTSDGNVECRHKIIAKISRPEVAEAFMSPAPQPIVAKLLEQNKITAEQASFSESVAMCDHLCVEADSGGHTDQGVSTVLFPAIRSLRNEMMRQHHYPNQIGIGLAGGIGTPEAAAAAFMMGADFITTGSINQCTVEAGTSDVVKNLLQDINVQDTDYAPAGDMFELGARIQVLKKGVLFPARANKLYTLYQTYDSLHEIPEKIQKRLQEKYFRKSFDEIWRDAVDYFRQSNQEEKIAKAEINPKYKMALVFRWYFGNTMRLAFAGDEANRVDYQVHTGPALGAFNQWVKGSDIESWRARHVDKIAIKLMHETSMLMRRRLKSIERLSTESELVKPN